VTTLAAYLDRTDIAALKAYLDVDADCVDEDARLLIWYATAIDWCHEKLSERDFVDSGGSSIDPPDQTVTAVYEFVRGMRDSIVGRVVDGAGIKRVKTAAREEEYFPGSPGVLAGDLAWPHLEPHCEDPTLFASGGS
jgi:hypothetical protein